MSTPTPAQPDGPLLAEAVPLAQQMHAALAEEVRKYREAMKCSPGHALSRLAGPLTAERREQIMLQPPSATTWLELEALAEADPEAAARRWEEVKKAARDELASGHRAVRAQGGSPNPLDTGLHNFTGPSAPRGAAPGNRRSSWRPGTAWRSSGSRRAGWSGG
jgi:hypothetical protein